MGKIRCASCGSENQEGDAFCGDCGAKLQAPPLAKDQAQLGVAPSAPAPGVQNLTPGGPVVAAKAWKVLCTSCGAENQAGEAFCGGCGAKLAGSAFVQEQAQVNANPSDSAASAGPIPPVKHPAAAAKARLVVKRTGRVGHEFAIDHEVMNIGRWAADSGIFPEIDLTEDDPGDHISRRHAKLFLKGGEYFIEDAGSTNGTYVNKGSRLVPGSPQKLRNGDEIIMGRTFFDFLVE